MSLLPPYTVGTVSIASNGTVVVGSSMLWTDIVAREGDFIRDPATGYISQILGVTDNTHLTVPAWKGAAIVNGNYEIYPYSPLRFENGTAMADVAELLSIINGSTIIYPVTGSVPDPSLGEDGNLAIKVNAAPWQLWLKSGGIWVLQGSPAGINNRGAWSSATAFSVNDVTSDVGSAYLCIAPNTNQRPPNVTYWSLIGAKGDTGATGTAATISVGTTSTGAAAVTNSGSSSAAVFNFTVPQGPQGVKGDQGIQGSTGPAPIITGTSTSVVSVSGSPLKSFTTQAGIAWTTGERLRAINAGGDRILTGVISSYSGTSLTLNVDTVQGVGSDNSWTITITGEQGSQGPIGVAGPTGLTGAIGPQGNTGAASTVPGPQGATGQGFSWNASGTLAQRAGFDAQVTGYAFLETDVSPFVLWVKRSNTTADWAGPVPIGANVPVGDLGLTTGSVLQSFDYGVAA